MNIVNKPQLLRHQPNTLQLRLRLTCIDHAVCCAADVKYSNRCTHVQMAVAYSTHCQRQHTAQGNAFSLVFHYTPFTRYNRLSNPVWQLCWTNSHCSFNRLSNRVVQLVWQPAVYMIQPVVKCLYTRYNRLSNPYDDRLYRVNGALRYWEWIHGLFFHAKFHSNCCSV